MKRTAIMLVICAMPLVFLACGSKPPQIGEQFVMERVPGDRPGWINKTPGDRDGKMFFVGYKTHASALENGNTDARQSAIQKIVEYLGGTGMVDYTKARVEAGITDEGQAGNYVEDGYRFLGESIAQGMREQETYYEHVKEWRPDGWHYFFNFYTLVNVDENVLRQQAAAAFQRQADQARARNDARAEAFARNLQRQLTPESNAAQEGTR
jgi:hypothetical protein